MDGLAGGLHPQAVHQVKSFDSIIKCGRAIVGRTSGMGQDTQVNSGDWAILIVDIGGKLGILGTLTTSAHLLAAMAVVASLSLGRSISAATAIGPTLLLGELWVCLLALHSAKLIGLWGLTTGAMRGALLLKGEGSHFDDSIGLQGLDFAGQGLAEDLSYDLHSRRELAEDDHHLHVSRELEASVLEIRKVAQHFGYCGSRMRAGGDGHRKEST